ncbi:MAG: hypothetical protein ABJC79_10230 [Acidimicrobiia bacterium]
MSTGPTPVDPSPAGGASELPTANTASIVETEADPPPIVLIVAATLRRAEETPKLAALMEKTSGTVTLRSTVDPQAATIRFLRGRVRVERGIAPDAQVTIATDLNRMSDEDAPKPKVTGALTHLRLALTAGKVLDPPTGTWQEEAARFWASVGHHPGAPTGLRVVCRDDHHELTLGAIPAQYEIHGSAHRLAALFSGSTVFGEELLAGHLYGVGSLRHTAELTGSSLAYMMGR